MKWHSRISRTVVIFVSACVVMEQSIAPLLSAQDSSPPKTAAGGSTQGSSPPKAAAGAGTQEIDGGWPRDRATPSGGTVRLFQPQVASWDGQRHMVAHAAVSYSANGAAKPALGTVKIEADTSVAMSERLVNFSSLKLTEANFPGLPNDQLREVVATITDAVPEGGLILALDRVLARLDKSQLIPKNVAGLKADPPVIFYSTSPAVLVNLDGDPIWSPIKDNDLRFAVNTNWDLFEHVPTKTFFLRHEASWLSAADVKGPWKPAGKLPDSFANLPGDENWKDVKAALPGRALPSPPKVFVSTTPAELILLSGAPNYLVVSGTHLLWVSNTESDVFRLGKTGAVYFLVSGRWFTASDFTGPWTFATPTLPEDFKTDPSLAPAIARPRLGAGNRRGGRSRPAGPDPGNGPRGQEAVKAPDVEYQGAPEYQPIPQTTVSRAVNTDKDIIKVGDLYYMCFQGVWFMGRSPNGPWEVTGSVPGQIYEIPVSSPSYNVTNVTVVEDNSDAVVFATAAAYTGLMIGFGCAMWGTGYYYPPYIGYGGYYPIYHPYYPTYGYHASYNPWTGSYSRGVSAYGPYGGAGVGARYNPRTGTYAEGRRPTVRAARGASPGPTTRARERLPRRGRAQESTAAGARRACSEAISGLPRRASRTV